MKWIIGILVAAIVAACFGKFLLHSPLLTFLTSAVALILLSKILGEATEQLCHHISQNSAGFINVTLSNLAEIIIIFVAVKADRIDLVQAGIIGSMIGNLLLILGMAVVFGTQRNGDMRFFPGTATLYGNLFFLVGATLALPTLFSAVIPTAREGSFTNVLAIMLAGAYVYFSVTSQKDSRIKHVKLQAAQLPHQWKALVTVIALVVSAVLCYIMSHFMVEEVEHISNGAGVSSLFIGYIVLPLLGNIAEHFVAVTAARKNMVDLSLAIALGSAAQVSMVVVPFAVLFGWLTNHPVTLQFPGYALVLLGLSLGAVKQVLSDCVLKKQEGMMLLALYSAFVICFFFT